MIGPPKRSGHTPQRPEARTNSRAIATLVGPGDRQQRVFVPRMHARLLGLVCRPPGTNVDKLEPQCGTQPVPRGAFWSKNAEISDEIATGSGSKGPSFLPNGPYNTYGYSDTLPKRLGMRGIGLADARVLQWEHVVAGAYLQYRPVNIKIEVEFVTGLFGTY